MKEKWPALMRPRPCTGALGADSPPEAHHGRIQKGTGPPRLLEAQGGNGCS